MSFKRLSLVVKEDLLNCDVERDPKASRSSCRHCSGILDKKNRDLNVADDCTRARPRVEWAPSDGATLPPTRIPAAASIETSPD